MGQIKVEKNVGGIEGLCVIEPAVHGDARGYFMETYNEKDMKEAGIDIHFVQDNQSISLYSSKVSSTFCATSDSYTPAVMSSFRTLMGFNPNSSPMACKDISES